MFVRNIIHRADHAQVLENPDLLAEVRQNIEAGDIYVFERVIEPSSLLALRNYLSQIGSNSLPNYQKIEPGCPNFHRINVWDPRSYVQACFHQFVFFPWNQDIFNLFELTKDVYAMRNSITGLPKEKFLGPTPEDGCTARIAFQFYPSGLGGMNKHRDPYDHHQLTVPTVTMSQKGTDFTSGGAYAENAAGERIYTDEISDIGDVVYFNSQIPHGVETIDQEQKVDWLSFRGRWMMLVAVNKLVDNSQIADAVDLEKLSLSNQQK
ncbi:MAG: hypothetical protein K2W82_12415 [Candidatus Obscuribacterales bacterium]|nr:hypothetical protein [Candidatus Obscuribacterales bacterium]